MLSTACLQTYIISYFWTEYTKLFLDQGKPNRMEASTIHLKVAFVCRMYKEYKKKALQLAYNDVVFFLLQRIGP